MGSRQLKLIHIFFSKEQLAYSKVDLNSYDNAMTRSLENYEDYSRNLNSNVSREGMIFQQFVENDFENDLHIHHSKRLILPSITRRYENMDFSINNSSSFNTNYRYTGLNQKVMTKQSFPLFFQKSFFVYNLIIL